jgi:hypothetical protein
MKFRHVKAIFHDLSPLILKSFCPPLARSRENLREASVRRMPDVPQGRRWIYKNLFPGFPPPRLCCNSKACHSESRCVGMRNLNARIKTSHPDTSGFEVTKVCYPCLFSPFTFLFSLVFPNHPNLQSSSHALRWRRWRKAP